MRRRITIEVEDDIDDYLADVLCYFAGLADAKDEFWENRWLMESVGKLRSLRLEVRSEIRKVKIIKE